MKTLKKCMSILVFFMLGAMFFSACDAIQFTGPQGDQGAQGEKGDKGDPGKVVEGEETPIGPGPEVDPLAPIELTGERYQKYYLKPITPTEEEFFDVASPSVTTIDETILDGYLPPTTGSGSHGSLTYRAVESTGSNQLTLYDIPFSNLLTQTPIQVNASGSVAVAGRHDAQVYANNSQVFLYVCGDASFSNTPIMVNTINYTPVDDYNIYDPFTGSLDNLTLPTTSNYSTPTKVSHEIDFSLFIPAADLEAMCPETFKIAKICAASENHSLCSLDTPNQIDYKFARDLTLTVPVTIRHSAESRNFYQYLTLTLRYPQGVSLNEIVSSPIVENYTYDEAEGTLDLVFKEYDTPYTGDVLSYTIVSSDGRQEDKVIKIGE